MGGKGREEVRGKKAKGRREIREEERGGKGRRKCRASCRRDCIVLI